MTQPIRRARGFALILALFLIVSLATIGAYLLTVSNVQVESGILDEQGARAYQAARAGLEWGAYQVLINDSCASAPVPLAGGLAGFRADVTCSATAAESEGGPMITSYTIVSTGCNAAACPAAATPGYVERQLQLTLAK